MSYWKPTKAEYMNEIDNQLKSRNVRFVLSWLKFDDTTEDQFIELIAYLMEADTENYNGSCVMGVDAWFESWMEFCPDFFDVRSVDLLHLPISVQRELRQLREMLKDDILETYDNSDHWSEKLVKSFVEERLKLDQDQVYNFLDQVHNLD